MTKFEPKTLGRFVVLGVIGRGGMGIVYKGCDPNSPDQHVAIKTLRYDGVDLDRARDVASERFKREAKILQALSPHPNIVSVIEVDMHGDPQYVVMRYVNGDTLHRTVSNLRALNRPDWKRQTLEWLSQAASACDYAHQHKVWHRDIKPENILVDGKAHLTDFGLGKAHWDTLTELGLTREGMSLGTIAYMSPEAVRGELVREPGDEWSFAATAFHVLTSRQPFETPSNTPISQMYRIVNEPHLALDEIAPSWASVSPVFRKAFSKDPAARWESCSVFVEQLASALEVTIPVQTVGQFNVNHNHERISNNG